MPSDLSRKPAADAVPEETPDAGGSKPPAGIGAPDLIGHEDAGPTTGAETANAVDADTSEPEPGIAAPDLIGDRP